LPHDTPFDTVNLMSKPKIEVIVRGLWSVNGQVLLCRNRRAGHLFLPGGHIEFGEPAAIALAREFLEESGCAVRVGAFLGAVEASFVQSQPKMKHHQTSPPIASFKRLPASRPSSTPAKIRSDSIRHHEINFLFAIDGLLDPRSQPLAKRHPPVVVSVEDHIEFLWADRADLSGRQPRLHLLPSAITPWVIQSLTPPKPDVQSSPRQSAHWASEWD
jgi:8-oxo-dGTP pyrophosphatase MutT (NUDIX family)